MISGIFCGHKNGEKELHAQIVGGGHLEGRQGAQEHNRRAVEVGESAVRNGAAVTYGGRADSHAVHAVRRRRARRRAKLPQRVVFGWRYRGQA